MGLIGAGIYISMSRAALVAMVVMLSVLLYRIRARWPIIVAMVVLLAISAMMPDRVLSACCQHGGRRGS